MIFEYSGDVSAVENLNPRDSSGLILYGEKINLEDRLDSACMHSLFQLIVVQYHCI